MGKRQRKNINWIPVLFEMQYMTNRELADKYDIDYRVIANKRRRDGIKQVDKWREHFHLLGKVPDAEIARQRNCTPAAVLKKRQREGIPPFFIGKETKLQKDFVETLDEYEEQIRTDYGIIDVLTDKYIYECKYILSIVELKSAIGQLCLYSQAYPDRYKVIVTSRVSVSDEILTAVERLGISVLVVSNLMEYDIQRDSG